MCPYPDVVDALAACVDELARGNGQSAYAAYDTASMLVARCRAEGEGEAVLAARDGIVAAVSERTGDPATAREVAARVLDGKMMPQLLTSAR